MKPTLPFTALTFSLGLFALATQPTAANERSSESNPSAAPVAPRPIPIMRSDPAPAPRPAEGDSTDVPRNGTPTEARPAPQPTATPNLPRDPAPARTEAATRTNGQTPDSPVMLTGNPKLDQILLEIHTILRPIVNEPEKQRPAAPAIVIPPRDKS